MTLDITNQQLIWWEYNWEPKVVQVDSSWALNIVPWIWWNLVETDLNNTVWGIRKVATDLSLFHWLWTYNIPQTVWHIEENWVELIDNDTSVECISDKWQMEMTVSWTIWDTIRMRSRRHPRYQPNRWHYFATAWYLPTPEAIWIRKFWLRSNWDWIYFKLEDWVLTWEMINSEWPNKSVTIDTTNIDLSVWNLFDIQYQWRWVWNYYFYVNLKLVWVITNLGWWTQVSISNPAMWVSYEIENTDWTQPKMVFGCCDVTSEWWKKEWNQYMRAVNEIWTTQWRNISWYDQPLIVLRVKDLLYWKKCTRDSILDRISASSDQKSMMSVWYTRDETALWWTLYNDALYADAYPWSSVEYIDCVWLSNTEITFNTAKATKVFWGRVPQDNSLIVWHPSENIEFIIEWNDYLILTWNKEWWWSANMFWNIEMWEEI